MNIFCVACFVVLLCYLLDFSSFVARFKVIVTSCGLLHRCRRKSYTSMSTLFVLVLVGVGKVLHLVVLVLVGSGKVLHLGCRVLSF